MRKTRLRIRRITPKIAQRWLDKALYPVTPHTKIVNRFAQDMLDGRWFLVADPIKLDAKGRLIDGRHRLLACVQANVAFSAPVETGFSPTVFKVVDK